MGKRYALAKKVNGGTGANQHKEQSGQTDHSAKTGEQIANENNVSERTARRSADYPSLVRLILFRYRHHQFPFCFSLRQEVSGCMVY